MEEADIAALELLADDVLAPAIVTEVTRRAVAALTAPVDTSTRRRALANEVARLDVEIDRLTGAIAEGGSLSGLVEALTSRDHRRADLRRQRETLERAACPLRLDVQAIEQQVRQRLADWRGMLGRQVGWTRQIFGKLLDGKMTLTPVTLEDGSKGYELGGTFRCDKLLHGITSRGGTSPTGVTDPVPNVASPAGAGETDRDVFDVAIVGRLGRAA